MGALVAGALALCVMAGAVVSDLVLDDGNLPGFGVAFFVLASVCWLTALVLLIAGRAPAVVLTGAVAPIVLAVCWELLAS